MKQVYLVSYPRSGQKYIAGLIQQTAGDEADCELYNCLQEDCPGRGLPVSEKVPCCAGRRFQKNHDFDLSLPVLPDALYAVIWRQPMYSLMSFYELSASYHEGRLPLERRRPLAPPRSPSRHLWPDAPRGWKQFAVENARFWRRFVDKWAALADAHEDVRVFTYEALAIDEAAVRELFAFCELDYDETWLADLMRKQSTRTLRGLEGFRFPVAPVARRVRSIFGSQTLALAGYDDVM